MAEAIVSTRISSSGQTTVPVSVRRAINSSIGDMLYWRVGADGYIAVASAPRAFEPATPPAVLSGEEAPFASSEWPQSFWDTLGALSDPTFIIAPEPDYADDAPRAFFDG